MTRHARFWAALAVCLMTAGFLALAGEGHLMVLGEGAETIDLADLRDGEMRTFGSGDRTLTATREGDVVRISRDAEEGRKPLSIQCRLGSDSCKVLLSEDGERVAMKIEKVSTAFGGEGIVGNRVLVERICDGDDCDEAHDVRVIAGGPHADDLHWVDAAEGDGDVVVLSRFGNELLHTDRVRLACPEGDATLTVEKEEAEMTFLCPKHSMPMEKKVHTGHRILIETDAD